MDSMLDGASLAFEVVPDLESTALTFAAGMDPLRPAGSLAVLDAEDDDVDEDDDDVFGDDDEFEDEDEFADDEDFLEDDDELEEDDDLDDDEDDDDEEL
jgi:hypothetical protein